MGCGCVKEAADEPSTRNDLKLAQRLQREEEKRARAEGRAAGSTPQRSPSDWSTAGAGKKLGGDDSEEVSQLSPQERRQRALEAAEKRQNTVHGVSAEKVQEMRAKEQKDALLGKLAEHYARQKLEMPMGLNAASLEQLKQHWETVRKDKGIEAALS
eukprot:TRINITY_DN99450_c0_g1_i1.p1 TRINITY_DN99450_c0_g1~~TRINITY_DN99450_c0_g1_i1.p1  ORF type:complete len:157 (-),score=45.53 TRINITY_DN99450_c0_g1_i1:50-520(-)